MMSHVIIFVPGIGDDVKGIQSALVNSWKFYGVTGITHELPWMDTEPFAPKLQRLLGRIDGLRADGHIVSLVGVSAGAGAVINAFAQRPRDIHGVVCIVGKINNPDAIGDGYRRRSPSFLESAMQVQFSLDAIDGHDEGLRQRIMSRYALLDLIVPREDSVLLGGINKTVWSIGHATTIVQQLSIGAPRYIGWLKSL